MGVTERRWLTAPVGTGTAGRDVSPSPRQCPRVGDVSVTHARRRRGKLPGASGPTRARSALPELRGGGGRRRARGRRGLLQCCNAALRRELSPRPGALHRCCNAGASAAPGGRAEPSRAEPGHAVQAPPGRPPLAPPRASALPGIVAPVSFFSRPCRVRGTCPPAVGHRQPPSPRPSIRPVPVAVGAHLNPPAGPQSALIALSPPASRRGSPRRRDHRAAPGTARLGQHSGLGSDPLRCFLEGTSLAFPSSLSKGGLRPGPAHPYPHPPPPHPLPRKQRCLCPVFLYRSSAPRFDPTARERAAPPRPPPPLPAAPGAADTAVGQRETPCSASPGGRGGSRERPKPERGGEGVFRAAGPLWSPPSPVPVTEAVLSRPCLSESCP